MQQKAGCLPALALTRCHAHQVGASAAYSAAKQHLAQPQLLLAAGRLQQQAAAQAGPCVRRRARRPSRPPLGAGAGAALGAALGAEACFLPLAGWKKVLMDPRPCCCCCCLGAAAAAAALAADAARVVGAPPPSLRLGARRGGAAGAAAAMAALLAGRPRRLGAGAAAA